MKLPWLRSLLDLVFPRHCICCQGALQHPIYAFICTECESTLEWIQPPCCERCSYPFSGKIHGTAECPQCQDMQPAFTSGRCLFRLRGAGKELIHALKYTGATYLKADIQSLIQQAQLVWPLAGFVREAKLVPVPLFAARERKRGFNQSKLIAECLHQCFPGTQVLLALKRTRPTSTQIHLSKAERVKNVKNAFALSPEITINPEDRYIIVDDVLTTGATLNACAMALKKAGARDIAVFTLGHG